MFESAELGHTVDKSTYKAEVPALRQALLDAQFDLAEGAQRPVILVLSGADGSGKREVVHTLTEWMDPRTIQTHAMGGPSEEERERPEMWRFWRVLPPRGKIGVFFHSWYSTPVLKRVLGKTTDADLDQSLDDIARFEKMLVAEGTLLFKLYDAFTAYTKRAIRRTDKPDTPWIIVDAADERYRNLTVAKVLLDALQTTSRASTAASPPTTASPSVNALADQRLLRSLDGTQSLSKASYDKQLEKYQGRLNLLTRHRKFRKRSVIAVFEGWDAAGKGGCIRRVIGGLDPRQYHIVPTAAPSDEERAQPYLWRFWRNIPRHGLVTIFDRSWYGRVLVERVEGFCSEADWRRAYGEINDFEEQLIRNGSVVVKFWLNISKDEQLRRFKEREQTGFKRFKITEEDWRNRNEWETYERAVCDMVDRTSTEIAPWTLGPVRA